MTEAGYIQNSENKHQAINYSGDKSVLYDDKNCACFIKSKKQHRAVESQDEKSRGEQWQSFKPQNIVDPDLQQI